MNRPAVLRILAALAAGALFGFGLSLSGMVDPAKILGFLNLASRRWDPSLMFVLGGALIVAIPGTMLQHRLQRPLLDDSFHLPAKTRIDGRLVTGSTLFGVG